MNSIRHAYLIIAHHEFEVLQNLILALDDKRNDIFVHIDKKVKKMPVFKCSESRLFLIDDRVDVRWGHVSQIESEYALFERAFLIGEPYARFHLISGTHMPLKSQDKIHDFFDRIGDKEVLNYLYTNDYEVNFKLNRFHFFLRHYRSDLKLVRKTSQFLWHVAIKVQQVFRIRRSDIRAELKANNWVSLTSGAVAYILAQKRDILETFKYSFCGDEYFVPYLLRKRSDQFKIEDVKKLLFNEFVGSTPRVIMNDEFDFLICSEYLFARKFSAGQMQIVEKILNHVENSAKS